MEITSPSYMGVWMNESELANSVVPMNVRLRLGARQSDGPRL